MPGEPTDCTFAARWLYSPLFVPLALLGMTLAMFAHVLFAPGDQVLSQQGLDAYTLFVYYRKFGFEELRAGRIALWNPHIYSGVPFMGGFEEALFYPLNWAYLILPLAKGIDCEFALHVFLLGLFTALWVGRYRLHPLAVLLAGSVAMFGRGFFGETFFEGHLPHLDSMAWVPLILLTVDSLLDEPGVKWVLIGIFGLAMQILAGYPQVVFNTIVACGLYGAIRLVRAPRPLKTVALLAAMGLGALLLAAVQLWTGSQAAAEGMRQGGVSFAFASGFSLSVRGLLTFLVPNFFGNAAIMDWRARVGVSCVFFGIAGLTMALFGMSIKSPHRWTWIAMAVFFLLVALGDNTPLFRLLYYFVPLLNRFRRPSAFTFQALMFLAPLCAFGMDGVLRSARGSKIAAVALLIGALALGGFGAILRATLNPSEPGFLASGQRFASHQSFISAGVCLVLAALFLLRTSRPEAAYILALFGIAEVFVWALPLVATFPLAATVPTQVQHVLAEHPGDYRILNLSTVNPTPPLRFPTSNSAIAIGASDIWGYDPMVPQRYAEFMNYSQTGSPDAPEDAWVNFTRVSSMFRMLRLRFVFLPQGDELRVMEIPGGLPHLLLAGQWQQMYDRNQILAALSDSSFDPEKTVILESDPRPQPVPGASAGTVRLLGSDANSLTIAADVVRPALLLVTDTYSRYWRAMPLPGSSQSRYQVLPADYTLMAVPLAAGRHHIRLEYAPSGYLIGRWVSLASLGIYLAVVGMFLVRRWRPPPPSIPTA